MNSKEFFNNKPAVIATVIAISFVVITPILVVTQENNEILELELKESPTVVGFNTEIDRCKTTFSNLSAKRQCEINAIEKFEITKLSDGSFKKLNSALTEKQYYLLQQDIENQNNNYVDIVDLPSSHLEDTIMMLEFEDGLECVKKYGGDNVETTRCIDESKKRIQSLIP